MICFAFSMVEMISELLVGDCVTVVGFGIGEGRGECSFCFTVALLELFPLLGEQEKLNRGIDVAAKCHQSGNRFMKLPNKPFSREGSYCVPASVEGTFPPGKWHNRCHKSMAKGEGIPLAWKESSTPLQGREKCQPC